MHQMGNGFRVTLRRRRLQRWIKREALLLAQEAETLDCPEVRLEASKLLSLTGSVGNLAVLRMA